jgi:DNA repair protein RecO (recombination protein O)
MLVTTEAIILKSMKYRDSSKILTVYTEQFGKCRLVANGARKAKNKFGTALDPTACSTLTFYKHPSKDLHTLSHAETAAPMRNLQESFERLTAALAVLEAMQTTQHDEESNPELYTLLKTTLITLNNHHALEGKETTLLLWFQVRLAEYLGFALRPSVCAETGEILAPEAAPEFVLSLADGAPYSPALNNTALKNGFRMEAGALAVLQRFSAINVPSIERVAQYNLSPRQYQQLADFLALYYRYHIDRNVTERTRKFFRDIREP